MIVTSSELEGCDEAVVLVEGAAEVVLSVLVLVGAAAVVLVVSSLSSESLLERPSARPFSASPEEDVWKAMDVRLLGASDDVAGVLLGCKGSPSLCSSMECSTLAVAVADGEAVAVEEEPPHLGG